MICRCLSYKSGPQKAQRSTQKAQTNHPARARPWSSQTLFVPFVALFYETVADGVVC